MRRLCFGGSFNPIHIAHLLCARSAAEAAGFDRVLLIPTAQSPHKPGQPDMAPAADRLEMCRLAALDQPELFETSDIEINRVGPSYTIDTAAELRRQGWPSVSWLIGADMLMFLPNWHRADELIGQVDFHVMARPGFNIDWPALPPSFRRFEKNVVRIPQMEMAATDIRARVKDGKSIQWLVPDRVEGYIKTRGLYRF